MLYNDTSNVKDVIEALPKIERFVRYYAGTNYSSDIMSEIKVKALELGFEQRGVKIESWLIEIAKNVCKCQFKKQKRNPVAEYVPDDIGIEFQPCLLEEKEMIRIIKSLPTTQNKVLLLTIAGYKCREIAKKLNHKPESVKSKLWIARNTLKNKLKAQDAQLLVC